LDDLSDKETNTKNQFFIKYYPIQTIDTARINPEKYVLNFVKNQPAFSKKPEQTYNPRYQSTVERDNNISCQRTKTARNTYLIIIFSSTTWT